MGYRFLTMNNSLDETERQAVLDILAAQLALARRPADLEANLQADLGADSLDLVEIVMALEERFDVTIPDEAAERVATVGDLLVTLAEMRARGRR